jgi:aminopeptidase YwaD
MTFALSSQKAATYLRRLSVDISSRRVGSQGNQAATDLFAAAVASFGFDIQCPSFDCVDWRHDGAELSVAGAAFEAFPSPYSLGCRVRAPLLVISDIAELEAADLSGKIVLLRGEIATEQLMPKNFPFYNPDHHRRIIYLLEAKQPLAIVAVTSRDLQGVGGVYPFPLFEDGDFDIPSVYMTDEEGNRLAEHAAAPTAVFRDQEISLHSRACRIPATGCNVIARKGRQAASDMRHGRHPAQGGDPHRRVVLFAHIDARIGSPGANDNASGVVALLLLAELLADYHGSLGVEIVAMNGEDYFSNPGEQQWIALNMGRFDEIVLGINLDDIGYHKGNVAYSLYDCPADLDGVIRRLFSAHQGLIEGEPWYQGDHGLFMINHIPALAITSELLTELMADITHTPKDTVEIVDPAKLVTVAFALRDLLLDLDQSVQANRREVG